MRARFASSSSARPTRTPWRSATRISARARFFMLARISSSLTDVSTITVWRYCDALRGPPALLEEGLLERRLPRLVHLDLRRERRASLGPDPIGQRRDVGGSQSAHPREVLEQPEALGQSLEDEHGVVAFGAEAAPGHMPWTRPPAPPPTCWTA